MDSLQYSKHNIRVNCVCPGLIRYAYASLLSLTILAKSHANEPKNSHDQRRAR